MKIKIIIQLLFLLVLVSCEKPQPRILIIGDSISLGYTPHVQELLADRAFVTHNEGNAQHTGTGLKMIDKWIGDDDWDIIQFNWGLWDLCYRHDSSKVQGNRDKINGSITFNPDEYRRNIDSLASHLKRITKADLLFVTTTYVPDGEAGRYKEDAIVYNRIAIEVMNKHEIAVNDIYDFSKAVHNRFATAPDNVHFTEKGYKELSFKIIEGLTIFNKRLNTNK